MDDAILWTVGIRPFPGERSMDGGGLATPVMTARAQSGADQAPTAERQSGANIGRVPSVKAAPL